MFLPGESYEDIDRWAEATMPRDYKVFKKWLEEHKIYIHGLESGYPLRGRPPMQGPAHAVVINKTQDETKRVYALLCGKTISLRLLTFPQGLSEGHTELFARNDIDSLQLAEPFTWLHTHGANKVSMDNITTFVHYMWLAESIPCPDMLQVKNFKADFSKVVGDFAIGLDGETQTSGTLHHSQFQTGASHLLKILSIDLERDPVHEREPNTTFVRSSTNSASPSSARLSPHSSTDPVDIGLKNIERFMEQEFKTFMDREIKAMQSARLNDLSCKNEHRAEINRFELECTELAQTLQDEKSAHSKCKTDLDKCNEQLSAANERADKSDVKNRELSEVVRMLNVELERYKEEAKDATSEAKTAKRKLADYEAAEEAFHESFKKRKSA